MMLEFRFEFRQDVRIRRYNNALFWPFCTRDKGHARESFLPISR